MYSVGQNAIPSNLQNVVEAFYERVQNQSPLCEDQPFSKRRCEERKNPVRFIAKGLRNYTVGRPTPEEQNATEDEKEKISEGALLKIDTRYTQEKEACKTLRHEVTKIKKVRKKAKKNLQNTERTAEIYREIKQHYKEINSNFKQLKATYQIKKNQLNQLEQKRIESFLKLKYNLYLSYLKDVLSIELHKNFLLYNQIIKRNPTLLESGFDATAAIATCLDFAAPGVGSVASMGIQMVKSGVEFREDKKVFDKAKKIITLCGGNKLGIAERIQFICEDISIKMTHRFRDHLPYLTTESLKKLAIYNAKQMFSSFILKECETEIKKQADISHSINLSFVSSVLMLGTLRKKKKQDLFNLELENSNLTWPVMALMQLTTLKVEKKLKSYSHSESTFESDSLGSESEMESERQEELCYLPPSMAFTEILTQQQHSQCRYSLEWKEEIEKELEIWQRSVSISDYPSFPEKKTFSKIEEIVRLNAPRLLATKVIIELGLNLTR